MLMPVLAVMLAIGARASDTAVSLGTVQRDLTGDGVPEVLRLVGTGRSLDSLSVTFSIESAGRVLYADTFPLTRVAREPGRPRAPSHAEYRARLAEFGREFFDDKKFMSPAQFLVALRQEGRAHVAEIPELIGSVRRAPGDTASGETVWQEIQQAGLTVFEYSPGGDRVTAVVWSARDCTFYQILECCSVRAAAQPARGAADHSGPGAAGEST